MSIDDWRGEIDAIDEELLRLMNRRATLAAEIGAIKTRRGLPICDENREREIVARAIRTNQGPLDDRAVDNIFRRIILESRRVQAQVPPIESKRASEVAG